jgi:N,N'-diacetyllegionaminate synthase
MKNTTSIICETACSHEGSVKRLKKFIDFAGKNKIEYIQFQVWKKENISTENNPNFKKLSKLEINYKNWRKIINYSRKEFPRLKIICCIYEMETLKFCITNKINHFKLHASEVDNSDLLNLIRRKNLNLNLSVGSISDTSIKKALKKSNKNKTCLMYGLQLFPTDHKIINLNNITNIKKKFKVHVGYQDHTNPKNILSSILPLVSIGQGSRFIEKHITDIRSIKRTDSEAAFTIQEFKKFLQIYTATLESLFSDKKKFNLAINKYIKYYKKVVVAKKNIKKNEKFSKKNLSLKWAKTLKKSLNKVDHLIGKTSKKNYIKDQIIIF